MKKKYYVARDVTGCLGGGGDWYFHSGPYDSKSEAETAKVKAQKTASSRELYYVEWVHADTRGLAELARIINKRDRS